MRLIARVSVRRHLIDSVDEPGLSCRSPKNVSVFRVLGKSPQVAIQTLEANVMGTGTNAMVALAFASETLTDAQAGVCQAVIAKCRSQAMAFVVCGGDLAQLRRRVIPGLPACRWFSTVAEMVQQLGKDDARLNGRNAEAALV